MIRKRCIRFILFITCLFMLTINEGFTADRGNVFYNLNFHRGRMTPHYALQAELNQDKITGIDFNAVFLNTNEVTIRSSVPGVGYFFSNLGNNEVYGYVHAAYFSMLFPLLTDKFPVQLKLSLGPGYVTRKYDPEDNHLNRALGSHFNAYGQISLAGNIPLIKDRWLLRAGISFNHVSNGLIEAPNQGINTLTIHAGVDLSSSHRHSGAFSIAQDRQRAERHSFSISLASGIKEVDDSAGKKIFTSGLLFDYAYGILPALNTGLGAGLYYNDTWAYGSYSNYGEGGRPLPFQSAVHLVLELEKNPVTIILNPGFYIYKPTDDIPDFTGRLGMRYSFKNNLTLMFAVKHHWFALADYFEWGIGYRFFR